MCEICEEPPKKRLGRREFFGVAALLAGSGAFAIASNAMDNGARQCAPLLADARKAISPDRAISMLAEGNARYIAGKPLNCDNLGAMRATAEKQTPFACVLGCIDSRAAPELVFDQKIGDVFVGRVAGNIATPEIIGSLEFATAVAGTKAIVVLGHTHCGAIKGAIDQADLSPNLTALLDGIEPAVQATPREGARSSADQGLVEAVALTNIRLTVAALTQRSAVLQGLVSEGKLRIIGALYDVGTGRTHFLA
ncbi:carbonic anhydrase family protein [Pseudogemmobacter bohemicus]|uniref:carbonic anhydrase family protein n=1 Tax=Pseudogemmobacter bohemicus TaxID=2250708 RepID=UPI000DD3DD1A|nr:carbonic anhydrase family protein [Pseudogemmobacter bohemicus]